MGMSERSPHVPMSSVRNAQLKGTVIIVATHGNEFRAKHLKGSRVKLLPNVHGRTENWKPADIAIVQATGFLIR